MAHIEIDRSPFYYREAATKACEKKQTLNEAQIAYGRFFQLVKRVLTIAMAALTVYLLWPPVAPLQAILLSVLATYALFKIDSLSRKVFDAKWDLEKWKLDHLREVSQRLELRAVI